MTKIKNIIVLGYPRTGTTYIIESISQLLGIHNRGELFELEKAKEYFGRNGTWLHEDLRQLRNGTPYSKPQIIKVMTKHVHLIGERFFYELMNDPSTFSICMYREDLWQTALSHIIARFDDKWNSKNPHLDLDKYECNIRAQDHMVLINDVFYKLAQSISDMKRFVPAIEFDKIYKYEDLTQDAYVDFQEYYDMPTTENEDHNIFTFKKLHTEQQKEDRFVDLEFLENYANEFYDMTGLKRYNPIDFRRPNT